MSIIRNMLAKLWNSLLEFLRSKWFFTLGFGIVILSFLLLSVRNPFEDRSVISNLEPYPDTLLYAVPVWNWLQGDGFTMKAFDKWEIGKGVPLTYGLLVSPFMWLFKDIRAFYFANELMSLATLMLVALIIKKIGKDFKWINVVALFSVFLLGTNFYIYTQPQLMMAENVNILLLSLFFYLLCFKIDVKRALLFFPLLVISLKLKASNTPIAGMMLGLWSLKLLIENIWPKKEMRKYLFLLLGVIGAFLWFYVKPRFPSLEGESFNWRYFSGNFDFYWKVLSGGNNRYLWYYQPLITMDVFILGLIGFVYGLVKKNYRRLTVSMGLMILVFTSAMSLFRDTEGRHVAVFLPLIMILVAFGVEMILRLLKKDYLILPGMALLLFINFFGVSQEQDGKMKKIVSLKRQIVLNIKYREDPWNYIAVGYFNKFFEGKGESYLGSLLPPFYVDLFGNKSYEYLPITKNQEFPLLWAKVYAKGEMSDYYKELLKSGKKVYVTNYYLNGSQTWKEAYTSLLSKFETKVVWQSPWDNANIYELSLKKR